jgi:hypothetical protein
MSEMGEVERLLGNLAEGKASDELLSRLMVLAANPKLMPRILQGLKDLGLDQVGGGATRDIGDYYREKPGRYELRWPLEAGQVTAEMFGVLDRKTQFFVLFTEWTRREFAAMQALNAGDASGAERIFNQCIERAEQIEVPELIARSYEGLMRVAERLHDARAAVDWSRRAAEARASAR